MNEVSRKKKFGVDELKRCAVSIWNRLKQSSVIDEVQKYSE